MTRQTTTQTQPQTPTINSLSRGGILQRKCESCGQHAVAGGECTNCQKHEGILQRRSVQSVELSESQFNENVRSTSTDQLPDVHSQTSAESRFNHNFSRVRVHTHAPKPIQTKLIIGSPNDSYEQEADAVADKVVRQLDAGGNPISMSHLDYPVQLQRKGEENFKEEKKEEEEELSEASMIMPQRNSSTQVNSTDLSQTLNDTNGRGNPLPDNIRTPMEVAFGTDFSQVRIHTGSQPHEMNNALQAQAFTYGSDIYFSQGRYDVISREGKRLLAHELTHVVQQTSPTKPPYAIQRASAFWVPQSGPKTLEKGEDVHKKVLPEMAALHSGVFTEVPIPNAKSGGVDVGNIGTVGFADLYRSDNNKIIGIRQGNGFERIDDATSNWKLKLGKKSIPKKQFSQYAAPYLDTFKDIIDVDQAPKQIYIADLKPLDDVSIKGGNSQLKNYEDGLLKTKDDVENFATTKATASNVRGRTHPWNLNVHRLTGLKPPNKYIFPTASGQSSQKLFIKLEFVGEALRDFKSRGNIALLEEYKRIQQSNVEMGKLYVVEDDTGKGIYTYAYIPDKFTSPAAMATGLPVKGSLTQFGFFSQLNQQVETDIVGRLKGTSFKIQKFSDKSKPSSNEQKHLAQPVKVQNQYGSEPRVQRKNGKPTEHKDNFDNNAWQKYLEKYRSDYSTKLSSDKDMPKVIQQAMLIDSYENLRKDKALGALNLQPVAANLQEPVKEFNKLEIWTYPGVGILGTFRRVFGKTFVVILNTYERVKEKVKNLARNRTSPGVGSLTKAAFQAAFRVFKLVGSYLVGETMALLVSSLQQGIVNNLQKLVDGLVPEELEEKIKELEALQQRYEELAVKTVEDWIKSLLGDNLAYFEEAEKLQEKLSAISTIVDLVRWGARILACASPPAVGCLWALAQAALEAAASVLIQTCWFSNKMMRYLISNFDFLTNLPKTFADKITTAANDLIPLPKGLAPLFAKIDTTSIDARRYEMECNESHDGAAGLTEDRKAIWELMEQVGEEKVLALLKLMEKAKVGPWSRMTAQRVKQLGPILQGLSVQQLEILAAGYQPSLEGIPIELVTVLKDMQKYKPGEVPPPTPIPGKDGGVGDGKGDGKDGGVGDGKGDGKVTSQSAKAKPGNIKGGTSSGWTVISSGVQRLNGEVVKTLTQADVGQEFFMDFIFSRSSKGDADEQLIASGLRVQLERYTPLTEGVKGEFKVTESQIFDYPDRKLGYSKGVVLSHTFTK